MLNRLLYQKKKLKQSRNTVSGCGYVSNILSQKRSEFFKNTNKTAIQLPELLKERTTLKIQETVIWLFSSAATKLTQFSTSQLMINKRMLKIFIRSQLSIQTTSMVSGTGSISPIHQKRRLPMPMLNMEKAKKHNSSNSLILNTIIHMPFSNSYLVNNSTTMDSMVLFMMYNSQLLKELSRKLKMILLNY